MSDYSPGQFVNPLAAGRSNAQLLDPQEVTSRVPDVWAQH